VRLGDSFASLRPAARDLGPRVLSEEGESLDSLVVDLQRGEAERRGRAVLALGESRDEGALDPVIGVLHGDEDPEVRWRAIWALEDLGGPRAMAAVAGAVAGDGDGSVRQRAVEALAKIGGPKAIELSPGREGRSRALCEVYGPGAPR